VEFVPILPENDKLCVGDSHHGRSGTNYVTHKSHLVQKHMFGVTCPGALFVEFVLMPPENEK
jgi:hypothetical protein